MFKHITIYGGMICLIQLLTKWCVAIFSVYTSLNICCLKCKSVFTHKKNYFIDTIYSFHLLSLKLNHEPATGKSGQIICVKWCWFANFNGFWGEVAEQIRNKYNFWGHFFKIWIQFDYRHSHSRECGSFTLPSETHFSVTFL